MKAAVIGAGVVGLFTALELASRGVNVEVYEAERPGSGASTANANVIHLLQPPPGKLRRILALEGARLHRVMARSLGYRIAERRLIIAALKSVEVSVLPLILAAARVLYGVKAELVSGSKARSLEPLLSVRVKAALVVEGYGVVDSNEVVATLLKALKEKGVGIIKARVTKLAKGPCLEATGIGTRCYDLIVNAAGLNAAQLASTLGDRFNVRVVKGVMGLYEAGDKPESILARPPLGVRPETKGGAIVPQLDGRVLVGPSFGGGLESAVRRLSPLVDDAIGGWRLVKMVEGIRPVRLPRDFYVGASHVEPKVIHLVGIESPGLTAAPAIALMAANLALKENVRFPRAAR